MTYHSKVGESEPDLIEASLFSQVVVDRCHCSYLEKLEIL